MIQARAFRRGQRVSAILWGELRTGTVQKMGVSLVFVRWDGQKRLSWQHPDSLTHLA